MTSNLHLNKFLQKSANFVRPYSVESIIILRIESIPSLRPPPCYIIAHFQYVVMLFPSHP